MRLVGLAVLILMTASTWAQNRPHRENRGYPARAQEQGIKVKIMKLSAEVTLLTQQKVHTMNRRALLELMASLEDTKAVLSGQILSQTRPHRPMQVDVVCSQDPNLSNYHQTFADIKTMAMNELNQSDYYSKSYAQKWTNENSCYMALDFIDNITSLIDFAQHKLQYSSYYAIDFAQKNVKKLCFDQDYKALYDSHYQFATRQLGYSDYYAKDYAWKKIQVPMLSCEMN